MANGESIPIRGKAILVRHSSGGTCCAARRCGGSRSRHSCASSMLQYLGSVRVGMLNGVTFAPLYEGE